MHRLWHVVRARTLSGGFFYCHFQVVASEQCEVVDEARPSRIETVYDDALMLRRKCSADARLDLEDDGRVCAA